MNLLIVVLLCVAALAFPFSVAATNLALGGALAAGVLSGAWWRGARQCWQNYKYLTIIICSYMLLIVAGLLWSLDPKWGLHVLGRQWFWMIIPVVVSVMANEKWRKLFLYALSLGLTLNLGYCLLQMYGYVHVTTTGSNAADATGHIGHIGFGFVYGIWAGWLLHLGLQWRGVSRWIAWALAAVSYVMIFSAQGRSGYLIAVVLIFCVLLKWIFDSKNWKAAVPVMAGFLLILLVIALGPGKERVHGTWQAFTQEHQLEGFDQLDSSDNAFIATQERFYMWKTSIKIWQQHPMLGVGTGGLPKAVADMKTAFHHSKEITITRPFSHPHNQYILNLTRWGPIGILVLLTLLVAWVWEGLKKDWQYSFTTPLFALSGLALALHALSSASMEEHFSAILASLLLAIAISAHNDDSDSGDCGV